jgi:hypothetical protein
VVSSWQRVAWAVGKGDIRQALELGLVAIRMAEEFGNSSAICAARLRHATALLLSGSAAGVPAQLRECLEVSRREGFMGSILDACALLASTTDRAKDSVRVLGCADACYARIGQIRGPMEQRVATQVLAHVSGSIDAAEVSRLRQEGTQCPSGEALALATELIAAPRRDSVPLEA